MLPTPIQPSVSAMAITPPAVEQFVPQLAEVPLFAGGVLPGTAIAAEPSTCAIFPRDAIRAVIATNPDVALALLERLATRVRDLVGRLDQIASSSVAARLAAHLLRRSEERRSAIVSLGMTQKQLAEELGTVREVIVRELRQLRAASIIRPGRAGWMEVVDASRLAERAGAVRIASPESPPGR